MKDGVILITLVTRISVPSYPNDIVIEASRAAHIEMWNWNSVDQLVVGMYIQLETQLTHELHRLERFNQIADRSRRLGLLVHPQFYADQALTPSPLHCVFCDGCLFYFRLIYNEWFVTKSSQSSWSNTHCRRP